MIQKYEVISGEMVFFGRDFGTCIVTEEFVDKDTSFKILHVLKNAFKT